MLPNITLFYLEIDKNKNEKNAARDSSHSSENNSFNRNLFAADNAGKEALSNYENKEKLIPASEKSKSILSKDPIEARELHF